MANYHYNRDFSLFEQQKYEQAAVDYSCAIKLKARAQSSAYPRKLWLVPVALTA